MFLLLDNSDAKCLFLSNPNESNSFQPCDCEAHNPANSGRNHRFHVASSGARVRYQKLVFLFARIFPLVRLRNKISACYPFFSLYMIEPFSKGLNYLPNLKVTFRAFYNKTVQRFHIWMKFY